MIMISQGTVLFTHRQCCGGKEDPDPNPHQSDKLDPDPDPHKFKDDKPNVLNKSLFEHFFEVLGF